MVINRYSNRKSGNLCTKISHIVDLRCELRKTRSSLAVTNGDYGCQAWAFLRPLGIFFANYLGSFETDLCFLAEKLGEKTWQW